MNSTKQQQKLSGQSSIAQKIYQFVPINEAWTAAEIAQSLSRTTSSHVDVRVLMGCLEKLVDVGLIRELSGKRFQRMSISTKEPKQVSETTNHQPAPQPKAQVPEVPVSAIDMLAGIAQKMRGMASDIENAALYIEESKSKSDEDVQKLRQLQALLKGIAA